ncbi:hypothetical protein SS50377_20688 [Spironucleus salmonicida]|uniref:Uncharacterized protein n=1 Tax=Spironucleus salmonicida TaxID=348837 RepID=V6LY10_9EUKA|nr:hypothetical protein SS50377_20688 [Spironucleus salmonicida]|eukprot:EST49537.1 Hypothetical protein SS50377_10141 [Spironucleus salmonicida]
MGAMVDNTILSADRFLLQQESMTQCVPKPKSISFIIEDQKSHIESRTLSLPTDYQLHTEKSRFNESVQNLTQILNDLNNSSMQ